MNITLNKELALVKLHENREQHIITHRAAIEGWKLKMDEYTQDLNDWSKQISSNSKSIRPQEPIKPKDYLSEYDDLINKLEYHALELIEVSDYEFDNIINNSFRWSGDFTSMSNSYSVR